MPMSDDTLLQKLPPVRGRYTANAPLGAQGWFKCGGVAEILFKPADLDDLVHFLKHTPTEVPVQVFGVLSNTIIRDGGVPGVTIRLGREFAGIELGQDTLTLGAAALDTNVAQFAADQGLTGLEFLHGIPGTIGGALKMNAGAIGATSGAFFGQTSISDVLMTATAVDRAGNLHTATPADLHMTYRHTNTPDDWIFTSCTLHAAPDSGGANAVHARLAALKDRRENAQPTREKTGGSTFANPSPEECAAAGLSEPLRAWQMIEAVGGKNLRVGGAHMSEKHLNFMINDGTATATDLETLGDDIITRVREKFGVTLRWEIKRVGEKDPTRE